LKLTDRLLTDEFTVGGIWSGNADFKDSVPGNLTYSYSNNQLHVEFVHTDFVIGEVFETFYGLISRGEIVTLINARVSSTKGSNVQHTKIVADSMIIDSKPISNVGSFSHREINFTYTNMGDWFGINPWNQTRENNSYYYEEPLLKKYKIESIGGLLEEKVASTEKLNGIGMQEIKLSYVPYYKLTLNQDKTIKELHEVVYKISLLFNLFLGKKLNIQFLDFPSEKEDLAGNKFKGTGRFYIRQLREVSKIHQPFPPYPYGTIANELEGYLNQFFFNFKKIKVIIQSFSVSFTGGNYVENSFLDACLNLEVLHREFWDEHKEVNDELIKATELIKNLSSQIEESIMEKITSSIDNLSKPTLRKRILELLRELPQDLLKKIDLDGYNLNKGKDRRDFAIMCSNTRNYVTHGSSDDKLKTFSLLELIKVAKVLNIISEYHVMKIIGLADKDIIDAISHRNYYQNVLTNLYEFEDLN